MFLSLCVLFFFGFFLFVCCGVVLFVVCWMIHLFSSSTIFRNDHDRHPDSSMGATGVCSNEAADGLVARTWRRCKRSNG